MDQGPGTGRRVPLLAREPEVGRIRELVASVRSGMSGVLVLRGEAGIGKSRLLEHAADEAGSDVRVVRLTGIESEMALGYAALHQLLLPYLANLDELAPPQRDALGEAFGLTSGSEPNRFLIGLATLGLLSTSAKDAPTLCVVDDAQWLDRDSADVLAFVARRLVADRVGMLFAVRDTPQTASVFLGLPEVRVVGLPDTAARDLLKIVAGTDIGERATAGLIDETGGNPLALVELSAELTPERLAGMHPEFEPLSLSTKLEARFLRLFNALPPESQLLVLAAAAEPSRNPDVVWRAARILGVDTEAIEAAVNSGLVEFGTTVRFRHPLIRSAVYHGAQPQERRRVHAALAAATDAHAEPDRRAWHRAAATPGVAADVADELEQAAGRARARGGFAAAAAMLERSARLTPDSPVRAVRMLSAAEAACASGSPVTAQTLLDQAVHSIDAADPNLLRVRGTIRYALAEATETADILLNAALGFADADIRMARTTLLDAFIAASICGRLSTGATVADVVAAAHKLALPPDVVPRLADTLLDGIVAVVEGDFSAAKRASDIASDALLRSDIAPADETPLTVFASYLTLAVGDHRRCYELAQQLAMWCRESGAAVMMTRALHSLADVELMGGSIAAAEAHFVAGHGLVAPQDQLIDLGEVLVLAWRGKEDETRAKAATAWAAAKERSQGWMLSHLEYALTTLELGLGNYRAAAEIATRLQSMPNIIHKAVTPPDLIEALVRVGDHKAAVGVLEGYQHQADASATELTRGLLARSRALVANADEAEELFLTAVEILAGCRGPAHKARTELLYGEWLRRRNRRRDARKRLASALEVFRDLGADAFAERTAVELRATGATARRRSVATQNELTPQEAQVSKLAAGGATNVEIGAQLFISPNTVDYHLRNVYRKLNLTSRRQLSEAVDALRIR